MEFLLNFCEILFILKQDLNEIDVILDKVHKLSLENHHIGNKYISARYIFCKVRTVDLENFKNSAILAKF